MAKFNFADHRPKKPQGGALGKTKSAKAANNDHEKELIGRIGAEKQPASGALPFAKGDYKFEHFLGDDKSTVGEGIIITRQMLIKINREALTEGKHPLLSLSFKKLATTVPNTWAVIPMDVFLKMLDYGQDQRLNDDFKVIVCDHPTTETSEGVTFCTVCGETITAQGIELETPSEVVTETPSIVESEPVSDIFALPEDSAETVEAKVCPDCGSSEREEDGDFPAGHWWWKCKGCGRKL